MKTYYIEIETVITYGAKVKAKNKTEAKKISKTAFSHNIHLFDEITCNSEVVCIDELENPDFYNYPLIPDLTN